MSKIRLFILAISISAAVYANYDTGYSGENGYTGYETEVYDQPAFSGGKSQGTGANGAASSGSRGVYGLLLFCKHFVQRRRGTTA